MDSFPSTVAICGGGACGLAILLAILQISKARKKKCFRYIYIFEKHSQIGPGLAYSKSCGNTIINMRADTMGLYVSDPLHFSRWMKSNNPQFDNTNYPPRHLYGEYLSSLFDFATHEAASQGIELEVRYQEVLGVFSKNNVFQVFDRSGGSLTVDKVVLALGNFGNCSRPEFVHKPGYFASPWPLRYLDEIPASSPVGIVGSRLSGIDAAFHLVENGHMGPIHLVSRGGRLPKVQGQQLAKPYPHQYSLHVLARDLEEIPPSSNPLRWLSGEFQSFAEQLGLRNWPDFLRKNDPAQQLSIDILDSEQGAAYWRALTDSAAPIFERYWNSLGTNDQMAFKKNWNSLWHSYVHAMPYENAIRLQRLLEERRILVTDFDDISHNESGFTISLHDRQFHVDYLIEATGLEVAAPRIESPLVKSLLSSKLLEAHHAGGFSVSQHTLESTTTKGLYVIGSLTTGVHFYTNGIDCNVTHASRIAHHLIGESVYPPAHVAVILPKNSRFLNEFLLNAVPAMLERHLIPFVYLITQQTLPCESSEPSPGSREFSQPRPVNTIPNSSQDAIDSRVSSDMTFSKLCESLGISVQSYEVIDSSLLSLLKKHHIDIGLLSTNENGCNSLLKSLFEPKQILTDPPVYLLRKMRDKGESTKMNLNHHQRCESEDQMEHYEREAIDVALALF